MHEYECHLTHDGFYHFEGTIPCTNDSYCLGYRLLCRSLRRICCSLSFLERRRGRGFPNAEARFDSCVVGACRGPIFRRRECCAKRLTCTAHSDVFRDYLVLWSGALSPGSSSKVTLTTDVGSRPTSRSLGEAQNARGRARGLRFG